jgi:outer membrane protein assembly factor BamB
MRALRSQRGPRVRYRTGVAIGGMALAALVGTGVSAHAGVTAVGSSRPASTVAVSTKPASPKPAITKPAITKPAITQAASDWVTYDNNPGRSGVSSSTPWVTSQAAVERAWTAPVDGAIYGQPLVVGGEVIVATENDSIYAFDRYSGQQRWRRHVGTPVTSGLPCGNINPSGITGTPVADVAANRLYVVSFSPYSHTLWTLNLGTGGVMASRPIDGPGDDPKAEQQRGALAIDGSSVFVPYGGLDGDCSDYHGWVVGAPVSGIGNLISYETPTEREAGIWSPPGPSVGAGGIYVATGNGTPVNAIDNSDSVIRLSPTTLEVSSTFTPSDYVKLSTDDLDLGTTSPVLLPDNQVFMIGKEGIGYLLDATQLGGLGHPLAQLAVCDGGFGGDAVVGETVIMSCFDGLYAVRVTPGSASVKPGLQVVWSALNISPGPPIVAGGIVWDVTRGRQLLGYEIGNGKPWFETTTDNAITDFPSLSASRQRLFVPEGSELVCYLGV